MKPCAPLTAPMYSCPKLSMISTTTFCFRGRSPLHRGAAPGSWPFSSEIISDRSRKYSSRPIPGAWKLCSSVKLELSIRPFNAGSGNTLAWAKVSGFDWTPRMAST